MTTFGKWFFGIAATLGLVAWAFVDWNSAKWPIMVFVGYFVILKPIQEWEQSHNAHKQFVVDQLAEQTRVLQRHSEAITEILGRLRKLDRDRGA